MFDWQWWEHTMCVLVPWEGDTHMNGTGMLIVSRKGKLQIFVSRVFQDRKPIFLLIQVSLRVVCKEISVKKKGNDVILCWCMVSF